MTRLRAQPTSRYRGSVKTLSSISRVQLLRELQLHGPQTIRELADATGLHHNTAREHLRLLLDAGFVRSEPVPPTGKGRPRLRYRTAAQAPAGEGYATQAATGQDAAEREGNRDVAVSPASESASEPASELERQLHQLDDHMRQCGFATNVEPETARMTIHDCPFAKLAREHPQVCEVHHGLVRTSLELHPGPLEAGHLHPFSGENECTLDFEARA